MKTRSHVVVLAGLALALSACIPSLHPYFAAKDLVADARLPGEWKSDDDTMSWKFEGSGSGEKSYTLTVTEKDAKHGTLVAHLFKIGEATFFDLIPDKCEFAPDQTDLVSMAVFPGHLLASVKVSDSKLEVAFIDWDWLKKFLEQNPEALAHHIENKDQIILTAQTADLQRFIAKHLGKGELFGDPGTLLRVSAKTTPHASAPAAAPAP